MLDNARRGAARGIIIQEWHDSSIASSPQFDGFDTEVDRLTTDARMLVRAVASSSASLTEGAKREAARIERMLHIG
jgi:hypothetical protein